MCWLICGCIAIIQANAFVGTFVFEHGRGAYSWFPVSLPTRSLAVLSWPPITEMNEGVFHEYPMHALHALTTQWEMNELLLLLWDKMGSVGSQAGWKTCAWLWRDHILPSYSCFILMYRSLSSNSKLFWDLNMRKIRPKYCVTNFRWFIGGSTLGVTNPGWSPTKPLHGHCAKEIEHLKYFRTYTISFSISFGIIILLENGKPCFMDVCFRLNVEPVFSLNAKNKGIS